MPASNQSEIKQQLFSTKTLQLATRIVLATVLVALLLFTGYYLWDHYAHTRLPSPVEEGIARMETTIHQDPRDPDVRAALAESYLRAGQYAPALGQAEQVLTLYPDHEDALWIAGLARIQLGQPEAAVEPLEHFIRLRSDRPMAHSDTALETAYYYLGESYVQLQRPADALGTLEAALSIMPTDADALFQAGLAYQLLDQPQRALERYHQAVRFVPDFAEAYQGMVDCYSTLAQPEHELYARGMIDLSRKKYRPAQQRLQQATEALPTFAPAYRGLALAYEASGQFMPALEAIQRALVLDANDLAAQQALGRIQTKLDAED
jgi:tetratricopeptide (TPR) repeat protein